MYVGDANVRLAELQNAGEPPDSTLKRTCQDKEETPELAKLFIDLLERQNMVICNRLARFPTSGNYTYWYKKQMLQELNSKRITPQMAEAMMITDSGSTQEITAIPSTKECNGLLAMESTSQQLPNESPTPTPSRNVKKPRGENLGRSTNDYVCIQKEYLDLIQQLEVIPSGLGTDHDILLAKLRLR